MSETCGILYGVGVGAGAADWLTLRAAACIRTADLICLPQAEKDACRAYRIALQAVPELSEKACAGFDFPMTRDAECLRQAHDRVYEELRRHLLAGEKVAFLTIGDPTVYSTFSYLMQRAAADGIRMEVINGVASYHAAAARLGITLCEGDEELHIGTGQGDLVRLLSAPGTKVILKCGKSLPRLKALLREREQIEGARVYAVSDCGLEGEQVFFGADAIPESAGYMTTVIVKEQVRAAGLPADPAV